MHPAGWRRWILTGTQSNPVDIWMLEGFDTR
jgi:hypothetical protein